MADDIFCVNEIDENGELVIHCYDFKELVEERNSELLYNDDQPDYFAKGFLDDDESSTNEISDLVNFYLQRIDCPSLENEIGTCWINSIIQFCNSIDEIKNIKFGYFIKDKQITFRELSDIVKTYCPMRFKRNESTHNYDHLIGGTWNEMSQIIENVIVDVNKLFSSPIINYIDNRDVNRRKNQKNNDQESSRLRKISNIAPYPQTKYKTRKSIHNKTKYIIVSNTYEKIDPIFKNIPGYKIIALIINSYKDQTQGVNSDFDHAICIKECFGQYYILDDQIIFRLTIPITDLLDNINLLDKYHASDFNALNIQNILYKKME